jgi:hypothetical protein
MEATGNVAQRWIDGGITLPENPMEPITVSTLEPRRETSPGPLHQMLAVYVDDLLSTCFEDKKGKLLQCTAWATMYAICLVQRRYPHGTYCLEHQMAHGYHQSRGHRPKSNGDDYQINK